MGCTAGSTVSVVSAASTAAVTTARDAEVLGANLCGVWVGGDVSTVRNSLWRCVR